MNRRTERAWITALGRSVRHQLSTLLSDQVWSAGGLVSESCTETNSDGWVFELGAVRGDRGSQLEVWLDRWTGGAAPRLCYCYRSTSSARVAAMARAGSGQLGVARRFKESYAAREDDSGFSVMASPLAPELFGRPVVELTDRPGYWSFLGVYEHRRPQLSAPPPASMVRRIAGFLSGVALASSSLSQKERSELPFPEERKRKYVKRHLASERDRVLAGRVKLRDGYRCKVCDMNFENRYGVLGRRFAEAHHVRQLGKTKEGTSIVADDLITVCANCHRMLHRMRGRKDDWLVLRRIVRKHSRGG